MAHNDTMHVIHPCAAGLDVHKMQITATVRLARSGTDARMITRVFSALPSGLQALVAWLLGHRVSAAVLEATGIYWETAYEALAGAGILPLLVHAQHVKQLKGRKTDVADSVWLARICQFGLCKPSLVPPGNATRSCATGLGFAPASTRSSTVRACVSGASSPISSAPTACVCSKVSSPTNQRQRCSPRSPTTYAATWSRFATPSRRRWIHTRAFCSTTSSRPSSTPVGALTTTTHSSPTG